MYLEATCPVCNSEIVHEIDVYERETLNGVIEGLTHMPSRVGGSVSSSIT